MLDLVLAAVAVCDQLHDEFGDVNHVTGADDDRVDLARVRTEPLHERSGRCHDHRWGAIGVAQLPQRAHALGHGLDARAHPLEGQGLPCRERGHLIGAEEQCKIVDQAVGIRSGRRGHDDRPALALAYQRRDGQRTRRFGYREHGAALAECRLKRGVGVE